MSLNQYHKPNEYHAALVGEVARYIQQHPDKPTLAEISAQVNMSPFHLQRVFKQHTGITPREYAEACRMKRFKAMLREARERDDDTTITAALYDAGFGSSSRVYEHTHAHMGMTPAEYKRGGEGMVIGYVITDSPMGRLLVGMTHRGVCQVCLGRDDASMEAELFAEYPAAMITRNHGIVCEWVNAILAYLNGWLPNLHLPTDIKATAFQRRVWNALLEIPPGETRTYAQIAAEIGLPDATMDVERAVAENPTAILIPCHRAVPVMGEVRGKQWKQAVLDTEHRVADAITGDHLS